MAKKDTLSYASLALLDWLLENGPANRFVATSGVGGMQFFDLTPVDDRSGESASSEAAIFQLPKPLQRRFIVRSGDTRKFRRLTTRGTRRPRAAATIS